MENFRKEFIDESLSWCWRKWIFKEDGIIIEEKWESVSHMEDGTILHCFCPYGNITDIKYHKNFLWLSYYSKDFKLQEHSIHTEKYDVIDRKTAFKFAKKQSKKNKVDFSKLIVYKEVSNEKFTKGEYIMQCQTCGHIFRYTNADLERNKQITHEAFALQKEATIDSMIWNPLISSVEELRADNKFNDVVNYDRCAKCNSIKLKRISEEELKEIQEKQSATIQGVSSADELKKFKELLDSGIITQEEFDQKKKQLLGL